MRLDGRKFDEVRPIWIETGVLPRTHGSAVFTRGETQALVTCTLGTADDAQKIESFEGETWKSFMLHYNFPPFSVGEVAFMRGPGRREVGHGALAERSLTPMMPAEEQFPYTIRIVSDILESNGSSSMASVCGGSLAMMDAGVPLKSAVAGIAMGLVMDEKTRQVRRALRHRRRRGSLRRHGLQGRRHGRRHHRAADGHQGRRHHHRSDAEGARPGAPRPAAHPRQDAAKRCRAPRQSISAFAPRIVTIRIPVDKIRDVIGPGGKMIRSIIERTGVKIDVEDDGRVNVASADGESAQKAISIIQELTATPELNKTYLGKIQRITDFGAFVEIMPGTDGLLHVSEIANHRVKDVRDELKEGEQMLVKVINIDPTGKIRLSRKALLQRKRAPPPERSQKTKNDMSQTQNDRQSTAAEQIVGLCDVPRVSAVIVFYRARERLRGGDPFVSAGGCRTATARSRRVLLPPGSARQPPHGGDERARILVRSSAKRSALRSYARDIACATGSIASDTARPRAAAAAARRDRPRPASPSDAPQPASSARRADRSRRRSARSRRRSPSRCRRARGAQARGPARPRFRRPSTPRASCRTRECGACRRGRRAPRSPLLRLSPSPHS